MLRKPPSNFYVYSDYPDAKILEEAIANGQIHRLGEAVFRISQSFDTSLLYHCFFLYSSSWAYWITSDRSIEPSFAYYEMDEGIEYETGGGTEEELTHRVSIGDLEVAVCAYGDGVEMHIILNNKAE